MSSYGIEGIAQWHEDPFGKDKIDINMDDVVEDSRREIEVLLSMWRTQGQTKGGPFQPHSMLVASPVSMDKSGLAAQPDEAQLTYMSRESTMVEGISGNPPRRDRRGRGDSGASGKQVRAERSSGDTAERNPGGDIERGDYAPLLSRKRDGSEGGYGGT